MKTDIETLDEIRRVCGKKNSDCTVIFRYSSLVAAREFYTRHNLPIPDSL